MNYSIREATLNDFEDIKLIHSLAIIHMNEEENHLIQIH